MKIDKFSPIFRLEILDADGVKVPIIDAEGVGGDLRNAIISVVWEEELEGHSSLRLIVENDDLRWFNVPQFFHGNKIAFRIGYVGQLTPKIVYSMRSIRGFRSLEIEAVDEGTKLSQTVRAEIYEGVTYSDVARIVAERTGFTDTVIEDLPVSLRHECVIQSNESDAAFMRRLASGVDFVFRIDGSRFRFHAPKLSEIPTRTLEYFIGGSILDVNFDLDLLNIPPEIVARGYDPLEKKDFEKIVRARFSDDPNEVEAERINLGKTTTFALLQEGPDGSLVRIERQVGESGPVSSTLAPTEALALAEAQAKFTAAEREQLTGEITITGDPLLRAGDLVELIGFGRFLDGNYYLKRVEHSFNSTESYTTRLTVQRNAVGRTITRQPEVDESSRNEQTALNEERVIEVGVLDPDTNSILIETRRGSP